MSDSNTNIPLVRNVFYRKERGCPLSKPDSPVIDYKNLELLQKYISERGRITPSRITSISLKMQRKLAKAIKRARSLGLLPYLAK